MKEVIIIEGQNLQDIAIQEYQDARAVMVLMEDNPDIIINLDAELEEGMKLNIREGFAMIKDEVQVVIKQPTKITIEITSEGQTLEDLAIQCYGSAEGVFYLIEDNHEIKSLNDSVPIGSIINIDETKVIDRNVLNYFKNKSIRVNTSGPASDGIGYWTIENDNVVS